MDILRPSVEVCFVNKIWEEKRERSWSPLNKHYPLNDKISSSNEQFDLLLHYILLVSKSNTPEQALHCPGTLWHVLFALHIVDAD